MHYLITGSSGFVAAYLIDYILKQEKDAGITGIDRKAPDKDYSSKFLNYEFDLLDLENLTEILIKIKPDYIVHLASCSSVAYSWENPVESFRNNTNIFLNILETVRLLDLKCRILSVGSSEEYGLVRKEDLPLSEDKPLNPLNPYSVARVAQEHLSNVYSKGLGLDIICTRSFNHTGPGQPDYFVLSSLGKKFIEFIKNKRNKITTGNQDIIRDFIDVRDVVRAYYMLLKNGKSGEVYNICSGKGYSIKEIIRIYKKITRTEPPVEIDRSLLRPAENPAVIGSYEKINRELGWKPEIQLTDSLRSVLNYWENDYNKSEFI